MSSENSFYYEELTDITPEDYQWLMGRARKNGLILNPDNPNLFYCPRTGIIVVQTQKHPSYLTQESSQNGGADKLPRKSIFNPLC